MDGKYRIVPSYPKGYDIEEKKKFLLFFHYWAKIGHCDNYMDAVMFVPASMVERCGHGETISNIEAYKFSH